MLRLWLDAYLNPCSNYDTHEEVRDNTSDCHHQAFNHCDTGIEAQHKEHIMREARMQANHEVANRSGEEGDQYQEWRCRYRVADDKCSDTIVAIQPLPLENL